MKLLKKLKSNKGFTIIEILCTMTILGLLMALAIPQFSMFRGNAKKAATLASARATVSTIIGCTALYDKDDWYEPRAGYSPTDYSTGSMSNYLETVFEKGTPGSNMHNYKNQYSDSKYILNWSSSVSGTGTDPAVFITNTSSYSHSSATLSNLSLLKGTIIVYFDTTGTGDAMTTNHIEVYYTDENGVKSTKPFIIVM